jgi:hypothetical protein
LYCALECGSTGNQNGYMIQQYRHKFLFEIDVENEEIFPRVVQSTDANIVDLRQIQTSRFSQKRQQFFLRYFSAFRFKRFQVVSDVQCGK